ncbi:helix-turn-helix domain-containing protein [Rhizobium halophytocola]|uniref:AraC-like DNA-binding protein n=1 Tax=Rhizobium halophytocola TaxID=735519 RepID=A0ABS4E2J5_9HYPH|nr:helix-turn-helix domain-containing protein [Rhizobium halophytocola]MBP1852153.1 AraC-like DNA-binding protein [Rhizobium halophytocola]
MTQSSMAPDGKAVPTLKFSTASYGLHEQLDAWRAFSKGMTDIQATAPHRTGFLASSEVFQLGSVFLTNYTLPSLTLDYGPNAIRKSQLDHWCLGLVTQGRLKVDSHHRGFGAKAGDLALYSYAAPFAGKLEGAEYSSLFFSRDDFWDIAEELDRASHLRVAGPMSGIIGDFLLSVKNRAHMLTVTDGVALNEAFGSLVRAMVRQTPANLEAAKAPIAATQFDRVRRFIAENLKSPDLTPDMICARLGLSRRNLFYLFENHGGVATFIKNRRLAACQQALAKINEGKLISSIAYEYGFVNPSSFSRQFQKRYGFRPSEARDASEIDQRGPNDGGSTFVDWLMRA